MTNKLSKSDVINRARECFIGARKKVAEGMSHLFRIFEENLWDNGEYSSFGEFCETGCGISAGTGSKLVRVYRHYVTEGGLSQRKIASVDFEKAYLAIGFSGTPDKQLIKAETLSRQQIRDELASDENGDCPHSVIIKICERCRRRME